MGSRVSIMIRKAVGEERQFVSFKIVREKGMG